MTQKPQFQCEFCGKRFVHETRYLKHECTQLKRQKEIRTKIGMMALSLYQQWMKVKNKSSPKPEIFLHSKFYTSFINFAKFILKVQIPDTKMYIELMVRRGIMPANWTRDDVYAVYLEHFDLISKPLKLVEDTLTLFVKYTSAVNVPLNRIYELLTPMELTQLIRQRRVTPWVLLNSSKFHQYLLSITPSDRKILEGVIRVDFWMQRFKRQPNIVKTVKKILQSLKL